MQGLYSFFFVLQKNGWRLVRVQTKGEGGKKRKYTILQYIWIIAIEQSFTARREDARQVLTLISRVNTCFWFFFLS